jgi:hypothetical protein
MSPLRLPIFFVSTFIVIVYTWELSFVSKNESAKMITAGFTRVDTVLCTHIVKLVVSFVFVYIIPNMIIYRHKTKTCSSSWPGSSSAATSSPSCSPHHSGAISWALSFGYCTIFLTHRWESKRSFVERFKALITSILSPYLTGHHLAHHVDIT